MIVRSIAQVSRRGGFQLLIGGALLWLLARGVFGPPAPIVRVVWSDPAPNVRRYLESRFSLTDGDDLNGRRWAYALRNTSEANRRALATHPNVVGVEGIDAKTFELAGPLPRADWRRGLIRAPELAARAIELAAVAAALAGIVVLWLPRDAMASAWARVSRTLGGLRRWLERGIPTASPQAAAAFRIAFGVVVTWILVSEPVYPELLAPYELARAGGVYAEVVRWLAAHPRLVTMIQPALAITGALLVAGVATRVSFACFTAVALVWTSVYTLNISTHATASLALTLLALLPVRWGDAWSVDAALRRHDPPAPARTYGYAFWVPTFVLGVTFAAAAWSKVREGPDWILNGTVKYHFVSDLEHAWVTWGPALTRWHPVAVAMTAFAVVAEALLITAVFSRSYAYRAALGATAAMLLAGFALFQGIVWLGWWVLLLGFLPWHRIRAGAGSSFDLSPSARITAAQLTAICLVIAQQVVASTKRIEARPMFSAYDMYATTYATPEDYEAASNLVYRVVPITDGPSSSAPGCVVDDRVAEIARLAMAGSARDRDLLQKALVGCLRSMPDARQIRLEGDRQVFDWNESRFAWKRGLDVIGPIDAELLRSR